MTRKEFCKQSGITENQFLGIDKIEGSLFLNSLTSIPDGWNPVVGGDLYLYSLTSIPDGWNPTVGGDLYLSSLTSIPDGWNPTVCGGKFGEPSSLDWMQDSYDLNLSIEDTVYNFTEVD